MEQTFSGVSSRNFGCTSRGWPKIPENRNNRKILFHSSHGIPEESARGLACTGSPRLPSLFACATREHVKRRLSQERLLIFMVTILKSMVSRRFASAAHLSAEIMQQRSYEVRKTCTFVAVGLAKQEFVVQQTNENSGNSTMLTT